MKAAEYILVILLLFCACSCAKQRRVTQDIAPNEEIEDSILTHCGIEEIVAMEMNCGLVGGGCGHSHKHCEVNEPEVLDKVETLLSKLPANGSMLIKFRTDRDIPWCQVDISDASAKSCSVWIFGNRLRCPLAQDGAFYMDPTPEEAEFVNLVREVCMPR